MKFLLLIFKNVGRNLLRSLLMALGTMVLVLVVTLVWSILFFIDRATEEKSRDFKAIVTERWSMPSRMPFDYAAVLAEGAAKEKGDVRPSDSMTWQFFVGTLDPQNRTFRNMMFGLACEPDKLLTMMDGLENLPKDHEFRGAVERLKGKREGIIVGRDHLRNLNSIIGDAKRTTLENPIGRRFKLSGVGNFKDVDLEFEIVGVFPDGRYDNFTAFNREYYMAALDAYPQAHSGRKHPLAERSLSLFWLKVPDKDTYNRIADQITRSNYLTNPEVKCETASSGVGAFMEAYRDMLWGMRWLLAPACIVTLALVLANAISISVRERRTELAVMKVLGFRPGQIVVLVLGEAVLLGMLAGMLSAGLTYTLINVGLGGVKFPIAFFDSFFIPVHALWWGPTVGAGAALVGSVVPAFFACRVKPAEVFAKVA